MGCRNSKPRTSTASGLRVNVPIREKEFKIVLLGNPAVGKTSIVNRYLRENFEKDYQVTIGSTFQQKLVTIASGETVKLDIWDTGGQERFRALLPLYYRDASAALITFDVTDSDTFEQCKFWVQEVRREQNKCVVMLVGNKIDCLEKVKVDEHTANKFADENEMHYMQTSAKTGQGVERMFETIVAEIVRIKP